MLDIFSGLSMWLSVAIGAIVVVIGAWFGGSRSGGQKVKTEFELRQAQREAEARARELAMAKERQDVESEISSLPASTISERLRDKYTRPD